MLEILQKDEVWAWYDQGYKTDYQYQLKGAQDTYILGRLAALRGKRILEVGGGESRVLGRLAKYNECWNAEPFEGIGQGPTKSNRVDNVTHVPVYVGDFAPSLPDDYFDVVFSISVVEHIANDQLEAFFRDCARIMKPGGLTIHAIDIYLFDDAASLPRVWSERIKAYRSIENIDKIDLNFAAPPQLDETAHFHCSYASNSDETMYQWNKIAPKLEPYRKVAQACSIKMELVKAIRGQSQEVVSTVSLAPRSAKDATVNPPAGIGQLAHAARKSLGIGRKVVLRLNRLRRFYRRGRALLAIGILTSTALLYILPAELTLIFGLLNTVLLLILLGNSLMGMIEAERDMVTGSNSLAAQKSEQHQAEDDASK